MMKRFVALVLVVLAAVFAYWVFALRKTDALSVAVDRVQRRASFESFVTASGEIVATRYADIGSSIMGRLVELRVSEGDPVKAGQTLAVIDPVQAQSDVAVQEAQIRILEAEERLAAEQISQARSELRAAQAREREATANLERLRKLVDAGVAPSAQLDSAEAAADAAEAQSASVASTISRNESARDAAQRRIAQANASSVRVRDVLSKTQITAPINGIVSRLQVREGEMVVIGLQNQPGTTLMTISNLGALNAEVKVAEADVVQTRVGQPAQVRLQALPGRTFSGKVVEVGASALPSVGTGAAAREFKVVIRLEEPDTVLKPGLTVDTEILVDQRAGALTVPLQAVVLRPAPEGDGESTGVFVVREGQANFTPVRTGIIGGLAIEVEGIPEGAVVVSGPAQVLRDLRHGALVKPIG